MRIINKFISVTGAIVIAASLTACGGGETGAVKSYDFKSVKTDPDIAAMVPQANRDKLKIAMDIPYSPAEFFDENNEPIGYEVDVVKALAQLMGVADVEIVEEDFDAILPKVNDGTYDMGVASLTLNKERMKQVNLISYIQAGFIYATRADNPNNFDTASPCGFKVAAQADTTQEETLRAMSQECVDIGKAPVEITVNPDQDVLIDQVIDGSVDAIIGESPMLAYAQANNEDFALIGEAFQVAPQGMAVAKSNPELAQAVQAGLQKMMDMGLLKDVLSPWGEEFIALNFATLNPPIA